MHATAVAASLRGGLEAAECSVDAVIKGQHAAVQQPLGAYLPTAGDCCDSYFADQPWEDVCFVPVGCTAMMDQLLDQLRPGSTCSSSQSLSRAAGVNSDGSKSSNSSQSSCQAQAAASMPVPRSPAALSSAEVHTSACTSLLASYSAAPGRTWCVMELPHDCIVSFESDAGEAAQQHTAQQSQCAVHGSNSGENSSKILLLQRGPATNFCLQHITLCQHAVTVAKPGQTTAQQRQRQQHRRCTASVRCTYICCSCYCSRSWVLGTRLTPWLSCRCTTPTNMEPGRAAAGQPAQSVVWASFRATACSDNGLFCSTRVVGRAVHCAILFF